MFGSFQTPAASHEILTESRMRSAAQGKYLYQNSEATVISGKVGQRLVKSIRDLQFYLGLAYCTFHFIIWFNVVGNSTGLGNYSFFSYTL